MFFPLEDSYWGIVETEHLTMGHKVLMWSEVPIMNWVLSDPSNYKIGYAPHQCIIKCMWWV